MIFNEPAYFGLIAVAAVLFRFLPQALRPWWLFVGGVLFYAYFSPAFVAVLLLEMALVFVVARFAGAKGARGSIALAVGLLVALGALIVYKYGGLLVRSASVAGLKGLPTFEDLRLPLAISFFTFEFVHYLVDARRGELPEHSATDFMAFALFIPTMVAGPIKRFQGFSAQAREARATPDDAAIGTRRLLTGLVKKVVLADTLLLWVAPLTTSRALAESTRLQVVAALIAYSLMIYLDFSGYSDIAIGSARLFGIVVPENFSWPYLKTNIADFWRSWHMSLTSWITDYVYKPLGGSRCGTGRQCLNLMTAMAVSGIWHGAAWNFLGWGLFHGTLLAGHRVWCLRVRPRLLPADREEERDDQRLAARALGLVGGLASGVLTFSLVTLGWGLFAMPFSRFVAMFEKLVP